MELTFVLLVIDKQKIYVQQTLTLFCSFIIRKYNLYRNYIYLQIKSQQCDVVMIIKGWDEPAPILVLGSFGGGITSGISLKIIAFISKPTGRLIKSYFGSSPVASRTADDNISVYAATSSRNRFGNTERYRQYRFSVSILHHSR